MSTEIVTADLDLDRERFLATLVTELAGVLQDTVGEEDSQGFIGLVGLRMGRAMDADYRRAAGVDVLDAEQVAEVLVDLKRRIGGTFEVVEATPERVVLTNSRCPFAHQVEGRESLCAMTSNVFGTITADNLGYAKVELPETIAKGDGRCRVVVHLAPGGAADAAPGHEFFGPDDER